MCSSSFNMTFAVVATLLAITLTNLLISEPTQDAAVTANGTSAKLATDYTRARMQVEMELRKAGLLKTPEPSGRVMKRRGEDSFLDQLEVEEVDEFLDYEEFHRFQEYQKFQKFKEGRSAHESAP